MKEISPKISIFKNSYAEQPDEQITIEEFVNRTKSGHWKTSVLRLREIKDLKFYKKTKEALPGITISGEFNTRDKFIPISQRIKKHSGYIALDIDLKDNPKMRAKDLVDKECLMQYVSCSGKGKKIIYRCTTTKDPAEHRRIYDAAILRLEKKGIKLKVDPIVKNIASLQYVSYDPEAFYFPKTKLVIKPLPAIKTKKIKPSEDQKKDIAQLEEYIAELGDKDITKDYENWLTLGMGLSYSLGETGREVFHLLSRNYPEYDKGETDEKFDGLLERDPGQIENPVTLNSVFHIINENIPKVKARHLAKKYNVSHAVGIGEDIEQGELGGMVAYKLFMFKKITEKDSSTFDLIPNKFNPGEFEALLKEKGFYRYDDMFVQIIDNIVGRVDHYDILRIVTRHIEAEGDYTFTVNKMEFNIPWEELVHLWREIRVQATMFNQITIALEHWVPNLLKDANGVSYIPYLNGVVKVTGKDKELVTYKSIGFQIWKERILPRNFKYVKEVGMFENFFNNVCGNSSIKGEQKAPSRYKRNLWYFGYMLHGFKMKSMARAWMLYDIKAGNNGRTGKSILGQAVGKIRNVTIIDGKQVDFRNNRFALQKVTPWTEIVFIDDPSKYMSLAPLFNMITGDSDAEAKGKDPLTLELKYMIASNWIMEIEGTSEQGRQFITQISDFYLRYSKEHNNCLQPLVHLHGKEFFTGWDENDWKQFDSFCIRAIQHYMVTESPENIIIGNAAQVRFVQQHEQELFHELATVLANNIKKTKDGALMVVQNLLVSTVKNSVDYSPTNNKCGRVAREFLQAVGCDQVKTSSMLVAGMIQMSYRIDKKWEDLNFGAIQNEIPKPKY